MAFTNHSDLFAAVHEHAINTTIAHLMRQRPSLFNYATLIFTQALSSQFCKPIAPPPGPGPAFRQPDRPAAGRRAAVHRRAAAAGARRAAAARARLVPAAEQRQHRPAPREY